LQENAVKPKPKLHVWHELELEQVAQPKEQVLQEPDPTVEYVPFGQFKQPLLPPAEYLLAEH
jgi:hypothetical protein